MKNKQEKTNVMRILDQKKIPYESRTYPHGEEAVDGAEVARLLGQDPETAYKTLVAQGASRQYYVFDIPVKAELDLKKAAKAVGEKSIAMLHVKELLPLTGYVRGGCSPIGMKKQFFTTFHSAAQELSQVAVSGGKIGVQVLLDPKELVRLVRGQFADIIKD
ncbi:MAG: Cys-tRNA(Pro) deacylase [Candidatus Onthomonas sp.]